MIKSLITIIIISIWINVSAQDYNKSKLDSMYTLYTSLRGVSTEFNLQVQIESEPEIRKCGTFLISQIKNNLGNFTTEQQLVLYKILQRPDLPLSIVSPSGYFRIHYTNSGTDAIKYDINLFALALDSSYNFEVNYLGYLPPPSDGSAGEDDKYDVYVRNLGNLYGQTSSENKVTTSSFTSYMEVDNDFAGFYTTGINAARVTAAHEFHHAIQMGNYAPQTGSSPIREDDIFFYEITSTAMEEFVFTSVNDYYGYMASYFRNPATPLPLNNGYNLAIWNIYLKDLYGFDVLKRQWELMPTISALDAINRSIIEHGSNLGAALNLFGIWTYYTGSRSINGQYFEEAANYPLITATAVVNFQDSPYQMSLGPTANYFLKVNLLTGDGTFMSIVTNSDIQQAYQTITNPSLAFSFTYSIYDNNHSGNKIISNKYSATFSKEGQANWYNSGILNDIVVYTDSATTVSGIDGETFVYPSPFRYSVSSYQGITIAFESGDLISNEIDFYVYSSALELVYSEKASVINSYVKNGKRYYEIIWNPQDNNGKVLASGVYIFALKIDSEIKKGKMVIFND